MPTYKPDKGACYNTAQAVVLGHFLESLGDSITPQAVVDAARPKRSPIHQLFEWNDTTAAERYRLHQARLHINHLEVVVTIDGEERSTRAYHSIKIAETDEDAGGRVYQPLRVVLSNKASAEQVVQQALDELNLWRATYNHYDGIFGPVFRAIDEVAPKRRRNVKAR